MELLETPTENTENVESNDRREEEDKDDGKESVGNEEGCDSSRHRVESVERDDLSEDAGNSSKGPYIVSLCGLPYSANTSDVLDFMEGGGDFLVQP